MIKYIFSINTGRSGSGYLFKILSCSPQTEAYHEAEPNMNGKWMRNYLELGKVEQDLLKEKIDKVKSCEKIYADTSHLFVKGFGWELITELPQDKVLIICLKRDRNDISKSLLSLKTDFFRNAVNWYISPLSRMKGLKYNYTLTEKWLLLTFRFCFRVINKLKLKSYIPYLRKCNKRWIKLHIDGTYQLEQKFKNTFPDCHYLNMNLSSLNVESKKKPYENCSVDMGLTLMKKI